MQNAIFITLLNLTVAKYFYKNYYQSNWIKIDICYVMVFDRGVGVLRARELLSQHWREIKMAKPRLESYCIVLFVCDDGEALETD